MKSLVKIIAIISLFFVLAFCASAPEPEPEPEPEVVEEEPEPEPEPEPEVVEEEPEPEPEPEITPLSEEEIARAEAALQRAREAEAERYAPDEYDRAAEELEMAIKLAESDPDEAREHIETSIAYSDKAAALATSLLYDRYMTTLENYEKKLADLEADKYYPDETRELYVEVEQTKQLFEAGKFSDAREDADQLIEKIIDFYSTLDENIRWSRILKRDTEQYMDDADKVEAFIWAAEFLEEAVILYAQGLEEGRNYNLEQSIDLLSEAKGLALKAVRVAPRRKQEYRTNSLMNEIERDIEEASKLTIITEDGTIIEPEEEENDDQSFLLLDEGPGVLGDIASATLLDEARELWRLGVMEKEQGNLEKADEYFEEAGALVHRYRSLAVGETKPLTIYETNTLWYIADQEYGNPFLWPIIWLYNKESINDPDFLRPGWQIVIPLGIQ